MHDAFRMMTLPRVAPARMDELWADGWRHFGTEFFRTMYGELDGRFVGIMPLRIDLAAWKPSKSQRRILRRNADVSVEFGPARIDAEREAMFEAHKQRFAGNVPENLLTFLAADPHAGPGRPIECRLRLAGQLYAVSYLDVGGQATSSVYAMFDPAFADRSPGIHTMLMELEWTRDHHRRWLYPGYAYPVKSHYDYKKGFHATEFYDWAGGWRPLPRMFELEG